MGFKGLAALTLLVLLIPFAYAHGDEEQEETGSVFQSISDKEMSVVAWGSVIVAMLSFLSVSLKPILKDHHKKIFFFTIALTVTGVTLYLGTDTIYTNIESETGGPVHWHADYEVWDCGKKLDLRDPEGLSNKIGTSVFHEHNDDRIHIEGVVTSVESVGLDDYFEVIGGHLDEDAFTYPTEEGGVSVRTGDICDGRPGNVQVFLFRVKNPYDRGEWVYEQTKLEDIHEYTPAPYGNIPPGDCVIIEFGEEKNTTDRMCAFYRESIGRGELSAD